MKKFLVIYHAPAEAAAQQMEATPEQQEAGMQAWMNWAGKAGDKMVDLGAPLMNGQAINNDGSASESGKGVAGYSIVQANSMEEAKALFEGHPHLSGWHPGTTIEVHEVMPIPGM